MDRNLCHSPSARHHRVIGVRAAGYLEPCALQKHPDSSNSIAAGRTKTRLRYGFPRTIILQGVAVLNKCANPVCSNQFRYLHQGKLFEVEVQYTESQSSDGQTKPGNGKGHVERCWLCDQCAASITLRFDARRGAVMVSSLRSSEQALSTVLSQSNGGPTARIVRVLIRPLDLELTASTRRKTARELDEQRREAA